MEIVGFLIFIGFFVFAGVIFFGLIAMLSKSGRQRMLEDEAVRRAAVEKARDQGLL